jgi:hypothetical protein
MRLVSSLRFSKLAPRERDLVLTYGQVAWAFANALPLLGVSETRAVMKQVGDEERGLVEYELSSAAFELLTVAHGTRALWVVARSGKAGLGRARQVESDARVARCAFRELSLAAIAFGSPSLRAQALHKLTPAGADATIRIEETGMYVSDLLRCRALRDADDAVARYTGAGHERIRAALTRSAPGSVCDEELRSIPDDVARAALANVHESWIAGPAEFRHLELFGLALPWLARAPVEELYLPRAWAERLVPELTAESIASWFEYAAFAQGHQRAKPVVRQDPKQSRNGACPCNSGMKWKRCCARKLAAVSSSTRSVNAA